MQATTYRILVEGVIPDHEMPEFVGLRIVERRARTTVLQGTLIDQPALLGTVARLEDLGCRVRDLHVVETPAATSGSM